MLSAGGPEMQASANDSWALFLRNYLYETDDAVALDTRRGPFHYFTCAFGCTGIAVPIVLPSPQRAAWRRLPPSLPSSSFFLLLSAGVIHFVFMVLSFFIIFIVLPLYPETLKEKDQIRFKAYAGRTPQGLS